MNDEVLLSFADFKNQIGAKDFDLSIFLVVSI